MRRNSDGYIDCHQILQLERLSKCTIVHGKILANELAWPLADFSN